MRRCRRRSRRSATLVDTVDMALLATVDMAATPQVMVDMAQAMAATVAATMAADMARRWLVLAMAAESIATTIRMAREDSVD